MKKNDVAKRSKPRESYERHGEREKRELEG